MFLHTFYTADVANPTTKMQQLFVFNGCGLFSYPFIFWVIHFHRELSTCPLICHSRSKGKEFTWLSKSLHNSRIHNIFTFCFLCRVCYMLWSIWRVCNVSSTQTNTPLYIFRALLKLLCITFSWSLLLLLLLGMKNICSSPLSSKVATANKPWLRPVEAMRRRLMMMNVLYLLRYSPIHGAIESIPTLAYGRMSICLH